jgi:NDP-sugar pyrophosphorylase family protein
MKNHINILIPMAGLGSRFQINGHSVPKPLIKINGTTMIELSINSLNIEGQYIFITRKYGNEYDNELETILKKIQPNCIIHQLNELTQGSAETCLAARQYIDNDTPLIITNCDQYIEWNSAEFLNTAKQYDGCVVTYKSTNVKNSFVKVIDNIAEQFAEKTAISDDALVGIHYWTKGTDFIQSVIHMMSNKITTKGEYYIAPTYNFMITDNKNIGIFPLKNNQYYSLGSPEDVKLYVGKLNEYFSNKPKTILCDIDGTILKHMHSYSKVASMEAELLQGVKEKFDEWDSKNNRIILMTGRKESARDLTEKQLKSLGLCWDLLIMNAGNSNRILINDKLSHESSDRALAINVITDQGFLNTNWEDSGL